jgi:DNA-binding NtrC family response regulator
LKPQVPTPPGRILIIDDEPGIAEVLRDALMTEGHRVDMAGNGGDGLKMATLSSYDLVFTDLGMPDMSGWEVANRIHKEKPDLPVVLVTGWGAALDEDEVMRNRISAVVHKPFDIDDLLSTTSSVLLKSVRKAWQAESLPDDRPDIR